VTTSTPSRRSWAAGIRGHHQAYLTANDFQGSESLAYVVRMPGWQIINVCVLILLGLGASGCSSEEKLHTVSGTATHNGKPIPAGIIFFDPDPMRNGSGPQGFASIKDGRYTTAVDGRGIRGGAYVIRITGYDGKTANEAPLGRPLFDEFEVRKELPAADSEYNIDVTKKQS